MSELKVQLLAYTRFVPPLDVPWSTDGMDSDQLAEFAGRACYQSWQKPNPATATNHGYVRHILDVGHHSVLEHASVSFYVTGVTRSLTHELVRHRHLSFSQLSQRFVPAKHETVKFVPPPVVGDDADMTDVFNDAIDDAMRAYGKLLELLEQRYADEPDRTRRRKLAREAARCVLPNATETKIVVSGNVRAWRQFIEVRGTIHAEPEIRAFAIEVLNQLRHVARSSVQDLAVVQLSGEDVVGRVAL